MFAQTCIGLGLYVRQSFVILAISDKWTVVARYFTGYF